MDEQGSVIILLYITLFPGDIVNLVAIVFTSLIITELLYTYTIVASLYQISHVSWVWLCTLAMSVGIYYLTIFFLNEYIDSANIEKEFMKKVGLIVLGSAGVLIFIEKVYLCIWPSFTTVVLKSLPPQRIMFTEERKQEIDPLEIYMDDSIDSKKQESQRLLG